MYLEINNTNCKAIINISICLVLVIRIWSNLYICIKFVISIFMNIIWNGQSCFRIEDKINGENVVLVTDPYDNSIGLRLPKQKATIVTTSHDHEGHNNVLAVEGIEEDGPIVFDRPGEYEVKGGFITGIGSYHDKQEGKERGKSIIFKIDFNGLTILHLGDLGTALSSAQLEKIENVDILLVPVGGTYTLNAKEAAEVVRQVEPRIVIPMHYKIKGLKTEIESEEKFIKEMGGDAEKLNKLKIAKKDLPQEDTKLIILEKN